MFLFLNTDFSSSTREYYLNTPFEQVINNLFSESSILMIMFLNNKIMLYNTCSGT